jgi:hypothetical protein
LKFRNVKRAALLGCIAALLCKKNCKPTSKVAAVLLPAKVWIFTFPDNLYFKPLSLSCQHFFKKIFREKQKIFWKANITFLKVQKTLKTVTPTFQKKCYLPEADR